jgi:biotin transport system substrate-specific component
VRALANWSGAIAGLLLILTGGLIQAALPGVGPRGLELIPLPITLQVPALLLLSLIHI